MTQLSKSLILGWFLPLIFLPPLHAQTVSRAPTTSAAAAKTTPSSPSTTDQAPDDTTKKITNLVHAGKYAEAQQLTTGLLVAYPNDQRLLKAKALIEKLLAADSSTNATPSRDQPANHAAPAQAAANTKAEPIAGLEKVDYNALILLARQAQQTTDLDEQNKLLQQFMDQSSAFLQKHPDQMLLWQFRVVSAIGLNEPMQGYEAGLKLLAMGAADSTDPALQQLLAQLKNKGWLDKLSAEQAEEAAKLWTDPATGLIWAKKDNGSDVAWQQAMDYCQNLQLAGHSGWRLPAINELQGIYDPNISTPGQCCGGTQLTWQVKGNLQLSGWHWSSSQGNSSGEAWTFYFHDGGLDSAHLGFSHPVRALCVLHSLATTNNSGQEHPASPAVPSSASLNVAVSSESAHSAETETAVLHVYRLKHFAGSATSYGVYIDGKKVSPIRNAQTIRMLLSAGKHSISVSVRGVKTRKPINDFDMTAAKEYWVRVDLGVGFPMDFFIVSLVPDDQAEAESRQLEEIKIGDLSKN